MADDIERRIRADRLKLLAGICPTAAVGVAWLGIVTPLLGTNDPVEPDVPSAKMGLASGVTVVLAAYALTVVGDAVRQSSWTQ
jgi:hypothetical protein